MPLTILNVSEDQDISWEDDAVVRDKHNFVKFLLWLNKQQIYLPTIMALKARMI